MRLCRYAVYLASNPDCPDAPDAFYNPATDTDKARRHLPHWEQTEKFFFVTFRLADSLPQEVLRRLKEERAAWRALHPEPWDEATEAEYYEKFHVRVEKFLDEGHGSCVLREERICRIVHDALRHFDGIRYRLACFAIMPNHVHVLLKTLGGHELSDVLFAWKSFTAHAMNRALGGRGQIWQHESWDRMIRSRAHFDRVVRYILDNPKGG